MGYKVFMIINKLCLLLVCCSLALVSLAVGQSQQIVITADGTSAFSSITAAIAAAIQEQQNNKEIKKVNIIINPGTYSGSFNKPKWITLTGKDCDKCVIVYDRTTALDRQWGHDYSNVTLKIIVAADGSGDFTNITAAIRSVWNVHQKAPVDIAIKPGIYREAIITRDWINLIGEERDKCIIADGGTATTINNLSTISAASNTKIKNLTFVGNTVRHVVNADRRGNYVLRIDNCTLRRESPAKDSKDYGAAFGIGLHGGQHIVMSNCVIEAALPVYMHNWNDQYSPCSMTLEQCVFKGQDYALSISNLGSKQRDFFVIHDSILQGSKGSIDYVNQKNTRGTSSGDGDIKLVGSGNTMTQVDGVKIKNDEQNRLSGIDLVR